MTDDLSAPRDQFTATRPVDLVVAYSFAPFEAQFVDLWAEVSEVRTQGCDADPADTWTELTR